MQKENKIVHTVWVGESLSLLEQLTIRSLQQHGHEVHLWAYNFVKNVPEGVILRDASEILPKNTIFSYQGIPYSGLPNNGIGSLSHWSDRFQMKLLSMVGGIYSQLDVTYFKPIEFKEDYLFIKYPTNILQTFLMKCPKGSSFAIEAYSELKNNINSRSITYMDWNCSMRTLQNVLNSIENLKNNKYSFFNYFDNGGSIGGPLFEDWNFPPEMNLIHWSNATINEHKNNPRPGSFYYKMLMNAGLI